MKRLFLFAALVGLFCLPASAQQFENSITGKIYAGTACTTTGACVTLRLPLGANSTSLTVAATSDAFTGTLTFEASADNITFVGLAGAPATTGVAVTTATAAGFWRFNVAGFRYFRVRCSTYTDGTLNVFILGSTATAIIGAQTGP